MKLNTRVILMTAIIALALIAVPAAAAYPQWGTFSPITPDTNPFVEQDVSMARYYTQQGDFNSAQNFINQAKGMLPYDPEVNAAETELQEAEAPPEEPVEEVTVTEVVAEEVIVTEEVNTTEETTEVVAEEVILTEETTPTPTEEPTQ